ncbi:MAG: 23S rRNA (guanosine(2251)-2'-O)-methyltransferase RlmB [Actinomycetota bacterium]
MLPGGAEVIYGRRPVAEALRAGVRPQRLVLARGSKPSPILSEIEDLARRSGVAVSYEARGTLSHLVPSGNHQGVVAVVEPFEYRPSETLLRAGEVSRLVLLDGVTDPANLGSILRSAEAFGWQGVLIPRRRAVGVTAAVRKIATGAAERVPVAWVGSPAGTVTRLHGDGFRVIGLDPEAATPHDALECRDRRICLVAGAEGRGLSQLVRRRCHELIRIPMRGKLASLNVAVALAVVMAEVARQGDSPSEKKPAGT